MEVNFVGITSMLPTRSAKCVSVLLGNLTVWLEEDKVRVWSENGEKEMLAVISLEHLRKSHEAMPGLVRLAEDNGWTVRDVGELTELSTEGHGLDTILWEAMKKGDDPAWLEEMLGAPPR